MYEWSEVIEIPTLRVCVLVKLDSSGTGQKSKVRSGHKLPAPVLNKKKDPERKNKKEVAELRSLKAIRISVCQEQLCVVREE